MNGETYLIFTAFVFGTITSTLSNSTEEIDNSRLEKYSMQQFYLEAITVHNQYRALHGVRPLILSQKLCHIAQINAEKLYDEDAFEENPIETRRYASENVYLKYSSTRPALITATAEEAIRSWYNEIETYDYSMGPSSPGITGHFTQVVWKGSKYVGMGIAQSNTYGSIVIIANYFPPGNIIGQFKKNVLKPSVK